MRGITKKTIKIIGLTLLLSSPILSLDRFFAGLNIGHSSLNTQLSRNLAINTKDVSSLGNNDLTAGVLFGYNNTIDETPLFVGFEIGAQYHNLLTTKEEKTFPPYINYKTTTQTNSSVTGILKIGILVKDLMFYAKGGTSYTNWKFNFMDLGALQNKTKLKSCTKSGKLFGFGIDYKLNENWVIGIEFSQTYYTPIKLTHSVGDFKSTPNLITSSLRIIYVF